MTTVLLRLDFIGQAAGVKLQADDLPTRVNRRQSLKLLNWPVCRHARSNRTQSQNPRLGKSSEGEAPARV